MKIIRQIVLIPSLRLRHLPPWGGGIILALLFLISLHVSAASKYVSHISGIKGEILSNAKKQLSETEAYLTQEATQEEIDSVYKKSQTVIKNAISPFGYFKPKISSKLEWNANKQIWIANFEVERGQRIRVKKIDISITGSAKDDPEFKNFVKHFPIGENQYLNTEIYKTAKQQLIDLTTSRGYFDAKLQKSVIEIDMKSYQAAIIIHLESGQRFKFGDIIFEHPEAQKGYLKDSFLKRFAPFKKGEAYDQNQIRLLQSNLTGSQYYQEVIVQPNRKKMSDQSVPILVKLTPRKGKRYNFGVGFGTDTGPRGLAGVELRKLTTTGHYLTSQVNGAFKDNTISSKFNLSYNIPGYNPVKDLFKFTVEAEQDKDVDYGKSKTLRLGANYISEIFRWQQTLGLTWHWERSQPEDALPFTTSHIIPSAQWQRIVSDDPLHPTKGYKINISVRGTCEYLLSDTSFIQGDIYAKYLHSFSDNLMLLARAEVGGIMIKDLEELPLSLRFFAGGSQSVRGYGYRTIKDGRNLTIASIELQQRLYNNLFGSVFFDMGSVNNNIFTEQDKGVGIGLVYRSVLGSISLTLAQALDKPGQPRRVEFSMGPDL